MEMNIYSRVSILKSEICFVYASILNLYDINCSIKLSTNASSTKVIAFGCFLFSKNDDGEWKLNKKYKTLCWQQNTGSITLITRSLWWRPIIHHWFI